MEIRKACTMCGEMKTLSEFALAVKNRDGHKHQCKTCVARRKKVLMAERDKEAIKREAEFKSRGDYVRPRDYSNFNQPYVVDNNYYVRNNGNTHIPSRGFKC